LVGMSVAGTHRPDRHVRVDGGYGEYWGLSMLAVSLSAHDPDGACLPRWRQEGLIAQADFKASAYRPFFARASKTGRAGRGFHSLCQAQWVA
jgi:hypothetical protein